MKGSLQRGEGLRTHSTEGKKTRLSAERMDVELVQAGVNTGRLVLDWDKNEATADFTTM